MAVSVKFRGVERTLTREQLERAPHAFPMLIGSDDGFEQQAMHWEQFQDGNGNRVSWDHDGEDLFKVSSGASRWAEPFPSVTDLPQTYSSVCCCSSPSRA